jgi:hypothetical protein
MAEALTPEVVDVLVDRQAAGALVWDPHRARLSRLHL